MLCVWDDVSHRFEESLCLHFQDKKGPKKPRKWRCYLFIDDEGTTFLRRSGNTNPATRRQSRVIRISAYTALSECRHTTTLSIRNVALNANLQTWHKFARHKYYINASKINQNSAQLDPWRANSETPYLFTYSTVQGPSWEANWFVASQEIPRISRNPKVHYRTHKRPPPVSILGQPNPVHIATSHLLEIHPNIIHPSMLRSPQWSPSLRFPH